MITIEERTWSQRSPELDRLQHATEPLDAQPVGKPQNAPLGVYLSYQAALFIEAYLQANPVNEMAGFLVGHAHQSIERPFIMITGAIEARDVVQVNGSIRFSQQTWTYLKSVWQREYANTLVLGWFHSQPGKGLALSDFNRFTHQRFFERTWQVSFVVDPLQNTSRFYRRAGRRLVPLEDFYLFDPDENKPPLAHLKGSPNASEPATAEQESAATAEHQLPPSAQVNASRPTRQWHGIGVLILLFLIATSTMIANRILWNPTNLEQAETLLSGIEERLTEARNEQQYLEELVHQLRLAADMENHLEQATHFSTAGSMDNNGMEDSFRVYVVKPGDTLWKISELAVGSPYAYAQLAELNQLTNPDRLLPGMILRLPKTNGL